MSGNALEDGRVIDGRYKLGRTLGVGMSGKVKLATDLSTGGLVALKFIGKNQTQRQKTQLQAEISAMKRLSHPNIIGLHAVDYDARYPEADGSLTPMIMLVVEYASGGEIFDFMMYTGAFPEHIARTYCHQLFGALRYCHENNIYHRDVKPENLLLTDRYQLKIADFGLSAVLEGDDRRRLVTECGTRSYMAPEIVQQRPYDGAAVDTWAAGVVLFIMLCGNPPFQIAAQQDWWFRKCSRGNYLAFWRAHERDPQVRFSDDAKAFLQAIFTADPLERAPLAVLMEEPWFLEEVVSEDVLYREMKSRKLVVDSQRMGARSQMPADDAFDVAPVRRRAPSEGAARSELSELPPGAYNALYTTTPVAEFMDLLEAAIAELGAVEASDADEPDKSDGQRFERTFRVGGEAMAAVVAQAAEAAPAYGAGDDEAFGDEPPPSAPPSFLAMDGPYNHDVLAHASVFEVRDGLNVAVLDKLRGDIFAFKTLVEQLAARLGSHVRAAAESDDEYEELTNTMGMM